MSTAPTVLADAQHALSGVNPYVIGGTVLVLLALLMIGLLAFGAGRDHT